MTESEEELKSLLMKVKEESWFKTQHSKIKIMASSPIISWQTGGETMATVTMKSKHYKHILSPLVQREKRYRGSRVWYKEGQYITTSHFPVGCREILSIPK